jgi:hypothetical protein
LIRRKRHFGNAAEAAAYMSDKEQGQRKLALLI